MSREPRERFILGVGAVLVPIILAWWLIWLPLVQATARLDTRVATNSRLLTDVRLAATTEASSSPGAARGSSTQSLVVLVDRTAQSYGLAGSLVRTRPDGANGINVTLQNASFDSLLEWVVMLEREHGVSVENASINATRETGLVNGQLFLRRP